jgi:GNAT superfamily N-acetyltransferase
MTITVAREQDLSVADYVAVIGATTLRDKRPLANTDRIRAMLAGANFIVTARDESNAVVGLARCITDESWVCYCAELAVRESHQGLGIGKALIDKCAELLGPGFGIVLLADPGAVGFYERIGMQPMPGFFRARTDSN